VKGKISKALLGVRSYEPMRVKSIIYMFFLEVSRSCWVNRWTVVYCRCICETTVTV